MLDILRAAERAMPELLRDRAAWESLDVHYHPPRVHRLWRAWNDHRVFIHRIMPCDPDEALFHPHPWPSAMTVLEGTYEMGVGYGAGSEPPPLALRMIAPAGLRYEMPHPDAWHYVRPVDSPVLTVMVTGAPWERWSPRPATQKLGPLEAATRRELFSAIGVYYPYETGC